MPPAACRVRGDDDGTEETDKGQPGPAAGAGGGGVQAPGLRAGGGRGAPAAGGGRGVPELRRPGPLLPHRDKEGEGDDGGEARQPPGGAGPSGGPPALPGRRGHSLPGPGVVSSSTKGVYKKAADSSP